MNRPILVLSLAVLALGCRDRYEGQAGAASNPSPGASPYAMESPSAYGSPGTIGGTSVSVEVVSVDSAGSMLNVRESGATGAAATGQGQRVTVSSTAVDMLTDLRPGDRITITCDGAGTTGTETGATGTGTTGTGSLSGCTNVTMITRTGGAAGQ